MIKTIIAENDLFARHYIENTLAADGRFEIIASVSDAFEAERLCKDDDIDLVIMAARTYRDHSGLAAGQRIKNEGLHTKVIIVTSLTDIDVLGKARNGAAHSLWYKEYSDLKLSEVIDRTLAGENVFPYATPAVVLKNMLSSDITPRQTDILRRFVMGMTYEEIAEELKLSKNGVRWNLDQIVSKGGFKNKHELIVAVVEKKFIVTTLKDK